MMSVASKTILIIDDAAENIAVLSELLRSRYRVLAAVSGEAGLQVVKTHAQPDLILLDVMMPLMDGYQVLKQLQALSLIHI